MNTLGKYKHIVGARAKRRNSTPPKVCKYSLGWYTDLFLSLPECTQYEDDGTRVIRRYHREETRHPVVALINSLCGFCDIRAWKQCCSIVLADNLGFCDIESSSDWMLRVVRNLEKIKAQRPRQSAQRGTARPCCAPSPFCSLGLSTCFLSFSPR